MLVWVSRLVGMSLPVRGRGLKLERQAREQNEEIVAPRAGAWIETGVAHSGKTSWLRRSPCGGVD